MAIDIDHILFLHFLAQDEVGVCKSRNIEQKAHLAHSCSQSECSICFNCPGQSQGYNNNSNYPEIKFAACT